MAHQITFTLPKRPLKNVDAEFEVKVDNSLLGRLKVSKGSLDWTPKDYDNDSPFQLSWSSFDKLMRTFGKRKKYHGSII